MKSEPVGASLSQTPPIEQLVTFIGGIGDLEDENFTQWELDELRRLAKLVLGGAAQEGDCPCGATVVRKSDSANKSKLCTDCAAQEEAPREDEHEKAMMEVLTERDEAQEWADNLAYAVGEYFDIDVGEHSSCSDPRVEAMKILKGEKAWHAALRMKRDATKAADAAFEKYQAAQLSLNTLLRIMIQQAEDSGAAAKG